MHLRSGRCLRENHIVQINENDDIPSAIEFTAEQWALAWVVESRGLRFCMKKFPGLNQNSQYDALKSFYGFEHTTFSDKSVPAKDNFLFVLIWT